MFKDESNKIGEGITTTIFLSLCIILIFSSISILVSLILDLGKQLLISQIIIRIILSSAFFGFGFGPLKRWRGRKKVSNEEKYWEALRQTYTDSCDR